MSEFVRLSFRIPCFNLGKSLVEAKSVIKMLTFLLQRLIRKTNCMLMAEGEGHERRNVGIYQETANLGSSRKIKRRQLEQRIFYYFLEGNSLADFWLI